MSEIPTRPGTRTLATAKKAAKALKKALRAGDGAAVHRFRSVFGDRRDPQTASHADCLHVIAREAGAESWPRHKLAVDTAAMTRAERIGQLERAVAGGNVPLMDRLLALDPTLADAHFGLQLALVRTGAALAALDRTPHLATTPIGHRRPIHHLCFSRIADRHPDAPAAMIVLLDALVAAGADVNQGYPAEPGSDHTLSPLYGALGHAGNLALAEALLTRGADPNDNESLYHATELASLDGVRLLFAHGAEIGTTNAFYRMLDREWPEAVALFLAHGANPDDPLYRHPGSAPADDRNALHHAILRGRSAAVGRLLIDAGVDLGARFEGRSPYALALATGNRAMADLLAERGATTPPTPAEAFLAAIARLDDAEARRLLATRPRLWDDLTGRDLSRATDLATARHSLPVLKLMAALGFDPNRKGESDMPPIHAAAWWGLAETVGFYCSLGVDLETANMFGGGTLGTAIHGSMNCPGRADGDYVACVETLLAAGAAIRPEQGHLEMGSEAVTALLEDRLGP